MAVCLKPFNPKSNLDPNLWPPKPKTGTAITPAMENVDTNYGFAMPSHFQVTGTHETDEQTYR